MRATSIDFKPIEKSAGGLGAVEDIEDISDIIPEQNIRDDFRKSFLFHDIEMNRKEEYFEKMRSNSSLHQGAI